MKQCFGALKINRHERKLLKELHDKYTAQTWGASSFFDPPRVISNKEWHLQEFQMGLSGPWLGIPSGNEWKWTSSPMEEDAADVAQLQQPPGQ